MSGIIGTQEIPDWTAPEELMPGCIGDAETNLSEPELVLEDLDTNTIESMPETPLEETQEMEYSSVELVENFESIDDSVEVESTIHEESSLETENDFEPENTLENVSEFDELEVPSNSFEYMFETSEHNEASEDVESSEDVEITEDIEIMEDVEIIEDAAMNQSVELENDLGIEEDYKLNHLLNRLDISDSIRRMNETAREDMADVIERDEEVNDLLTAIPADNTEYTPITNLADVSEEVVEDYEEPSVETDDYEEPLLEGNSFENSLVEEVDADTDTETIEREETTEYELNSSLEMDSLSSLFQPISIRGVQVTEEVPETEETVPELQIEVAEPEVEEPKVEEPEAEEEELTPSKAVEEEAITPLPKYVKPEFDFELEPISQPLTPNDALISEYDKVPTINDLERKWRELNSDVSNNEIKALEESEESIEESDEIAVSKETSQPEFVETKETEVPKDSGFAYSLDDIEELNNLEEENSKNEVEKNDYTIADETVEKSIKLTFVDTVEEYVETSMEEKTPIAKSFKEIVAEPIAKPAMQILSEAPQKERKIHSEEVVRHNGAKKRSYHRITLS